MDNEKEIAELFQSMINRRNCSYHDFRLLMENLSLNDKNRKRKAKQAVRFLCEKQDAAFVDGENSLRELRRLDQCPAVIAGLEKIMKDGETLLKSKLKEIFQPDSPEAEAMRKKIMDAMQAELQRRSREAGEKLYRKQQELIARHEKQEDIRKILEQGYMDESALLTKSLQPLFEDKYDAITVSEFEYRLKMWREEQITIVENELLKMIPKDIYFSPFGGNTRTIIKPEEGQRQATELAIRIVDIIYKKRLELFQEYHGQPVGGIVGNLVSGMNMINKYYLGNTTNFGNRQMQCNDWADLLETNLKTLICNWFFENKNSFKVQWIQGFIPFEHNLIRIVGWNGMSLYIDPWLSGGKNIVEEPLIPQWYSAKNSYGNGIWEYPHKSRNGKFKIGELNTNRKY